jgi:CheY-like chemotaxis protein/HPt (histidine-containing phosphotransfer) domain-containing protein
MTLPTAQPRAAIAVFDKTADRLDGADGQHVASAANGGAAGGGSQPVATVEEHSARGRGHLLLAEDDASNQLFARHLLELDGWRVSVVENGRDAVAAAASGAYDAILMDCQMPQMDGYQATTEIRGHEGTGHHTPIFALSADNSKSERVRCLAAGMDDYVAKPVTAAGLEAALERALTGVPRGLMPATGSRLRAWLARGLVAPVLDWSRLEAVSHADAAMGHHLVEVFVTGARERIAQLAKAEEAGELALVRSLSHSLCGSAAAIGATRMEQAGRAMRMAVTRGRSSEIRLRRAELEAAFALTETALLEANKEVTVARTRNRS